MDVEAEAAVVALKEKLEALDYHQPLGIESAPLVQQLLEDLVVTTTNYEALRERAETSEQGRDLLQNQVYALRKEHARVTRENNQLHLELIKASEAVDAQRDEYDHQRRTTNEKLRELEFLSTHQQRVIQQQDERINKLLEEVRAMKLERGANSTIVNRREIELTAYLAEAPSRPTASAGALPRSRRGSTGNASTTSSATFNVPTGNMDDAVLVVELRREIAIVRERADAAAAETAELLKKVQKAVS